MRNDLAVPNPFAERKSCDCLSAKALALQLLSVIVPALSMAYLGLYVIPEMRQLSNIARMEREEEIRHFERSKSVRTRINTEHALLLLDLEESRKLAHSVNAILKQGE